MLIEQGDVGHNCVSLAAYLLGWTGEERTELDIRDAHFNGERLMEFLLGEYDISGIRDVPCPILAGKSDFLLILELAVDGTWEPIHIGAIDPEVPDHIIHRAGFDIQYTWDQIDGFYPNTSDWVGKHRFIYWTTDGSSLPAGFLDKVLDANQA